ncbi:MAG: sulfopyruvate decarboxylase subunit beta [Methanobacteriaceae archaeon]|nr:sulfopyruvate decarboxylase subunit beta [Methanobacteriaceae archaeon]
MKRADAIKQITYAITDELVICNIGLPSKELYNIKDRNSNFYMLGSMSLATPIAFGLALALEETKKVIAIDGDGSMMMNLGELITIYAQDPKNLIIVLIDNGCYGSTGSQVTYATQVNLGKVAESIGFKEVHILEYTKEDDNLNLKELFNKTGPIFIQIKVKPGNMNVPVIDLSPSEIKNRFIKSIKK